MARHGRLNLLLALLLAALAGPASRTGAAAEPAPTPTAQAILLGEPSFSAALVAADRSWRLSFRSGEETRTAPAADLARWGAPQELSSQSYLLLVDGSLLAAHVLSSDETQLQIDAQSFGSIAVPLKLISGILFHPPVDLPRRDRLLAELSGQSALRGEADAPADEPLAGESQPPRQNSDLLILENGDRLTGAVSGIDAGKAALETQTGPISVEVERIVALRFNPSLLSNVEPRGLRALVGLSDGSLLTASQLIVEKGECRLSLSCAVELQGKAGDICFLQPIGGAAVYLSDLRAESYRHVPYLKLAWPYAVDANVSGSRLRASGRLHVKGIGMHSASRLTYRLDQPYRRFEAELAVDDETGGSGSVVFRVFVDNREAYKSPVIRGRMPPTPIAIDLVGGKRLSLIVDFGEQGDQCDHADWLDARLVK